MRSCRGRLVWILLAAAALLLVVAAVSVGLYLFLQQQPRGTMAWQDPVAAIVTDEIAPDWALYPLAGALELETIDRVIASGDLETAYTILVFSLDLSDAQRIGRLLLLGERFAETNGEERAALCYQQVYDTAVLSPRLSAPAQADALLASAAGWAALGQKDPALVAYDQVYTVARWSPFLQVAHRRNLLSVLMETYRDLGEQDRAELCRRQIAELDEESYRPPVLPGESPDLPLMGGPVSSPEVGELEETRRQGAYALLEALSEGTEPSSEQVASLAQALQAEDRAKLALYSRELEGTTQPGTRINVHWHRIRWLTLKYQVATKGFGLSLVPDWEAQLAEIQSALSKAYEGLFFDYEDLVTALPEAYLMEPGRYEVRRLVTLAGRLGQYPNYGERQMADKILDAVTNLISAGSAEQLYVDWVPEEEGICFILSAADEYGQPAQSP